MARSRKKSTTQHLLSVATAGLPAPVGQLVSSRFGPPLILLLLGGGLLGTGIVSVQWTDGRPSVAVDRERASEVKQAVAKKISSIRENQTEPGSGSSVEEAIRKIAREKVSESISSGNIPAGLPGAILGAGGAVTANPPAAPVGGPAAQGGQLPPASPAAAAFSPTVKIASFNIQVFGTSKLQKTPVMQVLADVVRRFDLVAIQEIRSVDDTVVPQFVALINSTGVRYDFVIGPRLGRTNSKEQYAMLYDSSRIEVDPSSVYTVPDPQDLLHREPLVARFRPRGVPPNQAFTFSLVNIHTDPDETVTELNALADVFVGVQQNGTGEDDVILLGDINVDEYRLGNLGRLPGIGYVVAGVPTNTRRDKTYDNIVFDRRTTVEYTGRWGVLDLMQEYSLTSAQALEVSDHMPVWAEFSVYEGAVGPLALQPGGSAR
ncbi:MAG: endonuclease/exonuclease/phosphatase family protein [Pirellulaceae bacterium]|jgi:endonuclease/exonuclease/phosphatase family metal-dependent hydrolase|nr:endonuclease/exonuclease/phosphatase family protein [Pirellulaceae bacterium]